MKNHTLTALKAGAAPLVLGFALFSSAAYAQDAEDEAPVDTIVVTGTRIASPNQQSIAPITTVTSDDISLSGTTRTEDLLNSLPQVVAAQSSTLANGATGTAQVDLRGLGPSRTLVLINGRRLMTGDPNATTSAADLNFIPSSLVKRVDVLTGGASATYGADAVAGVVNFVMDTDFEGFRIDANYGLYNHDNRNSLMGPLLDSAGYGYPSGQVTDGGQFDATISFGTAFDDGRGHATAYFGYRKANALLQKKRDYSSCSLSASASQRLSCGGSYTSAAGNVLYWLPNQTSTSTIGALGSPTLQSGTFSLYNYAPLNYYQRPDERYTAGVFADYEINEAIHPYMEFMFMDDRTVAQIAPSGDFGNTLTVNCDNPLLSASQQSELCSSANLINGYLGTFPLASGAGYNPDPNAAPLTFTDPVTGATYNKGFMQLLRRNVEGGPRQSDLQHTAYRAVLGSRGDLGKAWSYDAYYQYGRTNYSQVYSNEFSIARLNNALDIVTDPATGAAVCRAALTGQDPNCQPYDIFTGAGPSQAAVNYLSATGFIKGMTSEQILSGTMTGMLGEYGVQSPWASDGVSIAIGAEYRRESLELKADNAFNTGDLTGQGAPTPDVAGNYEVTELFGEMELPIIQDGPVYNLSFNGGYRYSHYKISNGRTYNTDTYKLGVDFAPVSDIRFRAGLNRAVRVPNIQELFAPQIVALDGSQDPCAGVALADLPASCLAQGMGAGTPANPAQQYNGLIGGNPDLNPEKSITKTAGVVLAPRWVPGLSLSVDYFDIKVKDAIQGYGADAIVTACTNDSVQAACDLIQRNAAGSLWLTSDGYVVDINHNVGYVLTRGFEFNGNYTTEIGNAGSLSLNFVGTALTKFETDNGLTGDPSNDVYDCAGYYGTTCETPRPKWRHKLRATFRTAGGIGVSAQWRYIGSVKNDGLNPSGALAGAVRDIDRKIGAVSYFDLTFTGDFGDHFSWRLGATNLFDKQPPIISSRACASVVCNGNTYPGTYDALGRYIFTGVTMNF